MSKTILFSQLRRWPLPAIALFFMMFSTLACTTDRTVGNGRPDRSSPALRSAPSAGVMSGSETAVVPPPMTSSSSSISTSSSSRRSRLRADEAAALMASHQRLRVLGPSDPGYSNRPYVTGAESSAAKAGATAATRYTVNETPFSTQVPGVVGDVSSSGTTASAVVLGGGATDLSRGTVNPTIVSGALAPLTTLSGALPPLTTMTSSSAAATNGTAVTSLGSTSSRSARATAATRTTTAGVSNPVKMLTQNGRVLITNVTARGTSDQR